MCARWGMELFYAHEEEEEEEEEEKDSFVFLSVASSSSARSSCVSLARHWWFRGWVEAIFFTSAKYIYTE